MCRVSFVVLLLFLVGLSLGQAKHQATHRERQSLSGEAQDSWNAAASHHHQHEQQAAEHLHRKRHTDAAVAPHKKYEKHLKLAATKRSAEAKHRTLEGQQPHHNKQQRQSKQQEQGAKRHHHKYQTATAHEQQRVKRQHPQGRRSPHQHRRTSV